MTTGLSVRQTQILKAIIDEYIETATPVGSEVLEKKYNLGVSSATVRNEMVALTKMGFLKQPHTSAGRLPSPMAMKFYIDQLMEEKKMSLADEVRAKEEVWDARENVDALLEEATHTLAEQTHSLSVAALDDGRTWHAGLANIFINPEFSDMHVCASLFSLLEEAQSVQEIFFERTSSPAAVEVIFGEDLGNRHLAPISIVATRFNVQGKNGALAVVGPARLRYPVVIPVLRYFGQLMEEISR